MHTLSEWAHLHSQSLPLGSITWSEPHYSTYQRPVTLMAMELMIMAITLCVRVCCTPMPHSAWYKVTHDLALLSLQLT